MKEQSVIKLKEYIGENRVRVCYRHPEDCNKCVKVVKDIKDLPEVHREIRIAKLVQPYLGDNIVGYDDELIMTDRGLGLVCGLALNSDGTVAPSLQSYLETHSVSLGDEVERGIREILRKLIEYDLFFYDFNCGNFVVKRNMATGELKVVFIDLKGFHKNHCWTFLKTEEYIAPFARNIMYRRMRSLYQEFGIETFPLEEMCKQKMFGSLFVKIR